MTLSARLQFQARHFRASWHFFLLERRRSFARFWRRAVPWQIDRTGRSVAIGKYGRGLTARPLRRIDKLFCERRLVIQSGGLLLQARLTPFRQGVAISVLLGLLVWLVASQVVILRLVPALDSETRRADEMTKAYEALDGEMMAAIELIDTLNRRLKVQ